MRVTFVARPSGASCNHVHIKSQDGTRILEVTTIQEVLSVAGAHDSRLLSAIKALALVSGFTATPGGLASLKTYLESKDL